MTLQTNAQEKKILPVFYGKQMGCGKPGRINTWSPHPAPSPAQNNSKWRHILSKIGDSASDYFFLRGLLFLYPTGEVPICAAIAEIQGHSVSIIICQSFTDPSSTSHAQRLPFIVKIQSNALACGTEVRRTTGLKAVDAGANQDGVIPSRKNPYPAQSPGPGASEQFSPWFSL